MELEDMVRSLWQVGVRQVVILGGEDNHICIVGHIFFNTLHGNHGEDTKTYRIPYPQPFDHVLAQMEHQLIGLPTTSVDTHPGMD